MSILNTGGFFMDGSLFLSFAALLPLAVSSSPTREKLWFDSENCAFCSTLTRDPNLMKNMSLEYRDLTNGLLILATVKPESRASYARAREEMNNIGKEMMQGKNITTCGHCETYGKILQAGANYESIATDSGDATIFTTDKPELLGTIRDFARRSREAMTSK